MNARVLRCKIIAQMLVADGMMTADERTFLDDCMNDVGLDDDERAQVVAIDPAEDIASEARGLPVEERREIVDLLVRAALADGRLSPYEMKLIRELTEALDL